MTARHLRVRAVVRFTVLTVTVAVWVVLAHAIPAALALAVGL